MANAKQAIGIVLLLLGFVLIVLGILSVVNAMGTFNFASGAMGIGLIVGGGFLLMIGGLVLFFTNLRRINTHVATETAPGIEKTTEAIGRGLSKGFQKK